MAGSIWPKAKASARSSRRAPALGRELEALELEAWRDRAADQGPVAERFSGLPGACRHHGLRALAERQIRSEPQRLRACAVVDLKLQRAAGMPVPGFGGVGAVPVRALAALEQEVDRGRGGAAARDGLRVAGGAER